MPTQLMRRSTGVWGTNSWPLPNGLQFAADRPENHNGSDLVSNYTGINSEIPHVFANGTGRYLLGTCVNWGTAFNGQDLAGANDETWELALHEPDGSAIYRGHFVRVRHDDGTVTDLPDLPLSVTIGPSDEADAVFDLGAAKAAGSRLIERCYVSVASGASMVLHRANGATGCFAKASSEGSTYSAGESNQVTQRFTTFPTPANPYAGGGSVVGTSGTSWFGKWMMSIRHIDAPPAQLWYPTLVVGDSLTAGPFGWRTFLNDSFHVPHATLAETGEQARTFLLNDWQSKYRRRFAALGGYQRGILQYGTNDLAARIPTQTLAIFQANLSALLTLIESWGLTVAEIIVATLPPATKSTDGWTTLAGQVLDMALNQRGKNEQLLLDYNAWLRQGTQVFGNPVAWLHPNGFYVADGASAVTVMDSSSGDTPSTIAKWAVLAGRASTRDGLHPGTTSGLTAWAGVLPAPFFQQSTGA